MSQQQSFPIYRPDHNTQFVAVETRPTNKPVDVNVFDVPTSLQVHPEVVITAYPSAKIKNVVDSGNGNVQVVIDASSIPAKVPMQHDININAAAGTVVAEYAKYALANDIPVFFGYEQRRKARSGATGDYIPYTTPILELAGWTADRKKMTMEATRANISKVLAAIGPADDPAVSYLNFDEVRCDPRTWKIFSTNYEGKLTPAEWVRPTDADGNPTGCLIAEKDAPERPLSPLIEKRLTSIDSRLSNLESAPTYNTARGEAKPWALRNHRGEINPGSYAVTAASRASRQARRLIRTALTGVDDVTTEQRRTSADKLTTVLLWLTDHVQQDVTGYTDRTASSYRTAGDQITDAIEFDLPYTAEFIDDADAAKAWASEVRHLAATGFRDAVEATARWAQPATEEKAADTAEGDTATAENATEESSEQSPAAGQEAQATEQDQQGQQETPSDDAAQNDQAAGQQMVADVPDLCDRWDALITRINMASHITHLNPVLVAEFGTCMTGEIPAAAFTPLLTAWEADPAAFTKKAAAAYKADRASQAA
jgi:hypothetical protein